MKPFSDDSAAATLGDMNIENGTDSIAVHGSMDITRDKAGLKKARALLDHLIEIVAVLDEDPELPEKVSPAKGPAIVQVRNPLL